MCNSSAIVAKLGGDVPWVKISTEFVHGRRDSLKLAMVYLSHLYSYWGKIYLIHILNGITWIKFMGLFIGERAGVFSERRRSNCTFFKLILVTNGLSPYGLGSDGTKPLPQLMLTYQ